MNQDAIVAATTVTARFGWLRWLIVACVAGVLSLVLLFPFSQTGRHWSEIFNLAHATSFFLAFLFAAARYSAHVGKAVLDVTDHETFVKEMADHYADMLRQHLGDPSL